MLSGLGYCEKKAEQKIYQITNTIIYVESLRTEFRDKFDAKKQR